MTEFNPKDINKTILVILDGYGFTTDTEGNAVSAASTPFLDKVMNSYPNTLLACSGLEVGLPKGQMGNSEVGHLNIGAGRVVYQELTRITKAIGDGDFFNNEAFSRAINNAIENQSALHLMGLVSDGGVHSELEHLKALVKLAKIKNVEKVYIHCFTDGRDTPPRSADDYISELEQYLKKIGCGKISTVTGRYFAMDRDKRYDRLQRAYDALTRGEGNRFASANEAVKASYGNDISDEFIEPCIITENGEPVGLINDNDSVIFFNFRADRAREITDAFTQNGFSGFERKKKVSVTYICMTEYDADFTNIDIAFKPSVMKNTLGEYLSDSGIYQLRIAETEKYAHVTYFFNGGIEEPNKFEDRIMIPSPKVATYDLKPEMSAYEVTDALVEKIESEKYGFILINYANCDMVGHTGVFEAAVKAVETVDVCAAKLYEKAKEHGYTMLITADHGNAESMFKGEDIITSHTTNPVKLALLSGNVSALNPGALCDIAPTVLKIMGLEKPAEMTGKALF